MKYSIVIPTYNEEKNLKKTLVLLRKYTKNRKDIEIIIVDDNSSDDTHKIIKSANISKYVLYSEHKGISKCRNKGVALASGDYILFFEGHTKLKDNIFDSYDIIFEKYKNIDGISGTYHSILSTDYNNLRDVVRDIYRKKNEGNFIITDENFTTFSTCIFCVKKEIILKYPFSEKFKDVAAEDTFLQFILREKNYTFLHSNKISIIHDTNLSLWELLKKIKYQCKGTHRLLAQLSNHNLKNIPYLPFYLDFPLLSALTFYFSLLIIPFTGIFSFYFSVFLFSVFLDFFDLKKMILSKKYKFKIKLQTTIYIFLNELIKIIDWPISIFREKYKFKDLKWVIKQFIIWQMTKFKRIKNEIRFFKSSTFKNTAFIRRDKT